MLDFSSVQYVGSCNSWKETVALEEWLTITLSASSHISIFVLMNALYCGRITAYYGKQFENIKEFHKRMQLWNKICSVYCAITLSDAENEQ